MARRKAAPPAKARPAPPRNLTPELCDCLRRDLLAGCQEVAETHGLVAEGGDLDDIDLRHGFNIRFRVGIPMADGSLYSTEKALFEALAPSFGLEANDFRRTFRSGGAVFRITAINPNRPKYPISAERIGDERSYKVSVKDVLAYLGTSDAQDCPGNQPLSALRRARAGR